MDTYDRAEVLARTDLKVLADEVLGPRKGRGTSATWPCPSPDHGPQTGRTPPVSTFRTRAGEERWRCHGCGAGGTALDLVITSQRASFREAVELLARRANVASTSELVALRRASPATAPSPSASTSTEPNPVLETYVERCQAVLWSDQGRVTRLWLKSRGFGPEVLRANRVGADPGPSALPRPPGLPRGGPAVVLPVLGPDDGVRYLQARYLRPGGRKYDNPAAGLVGTSPRLAEVRLPGPTVRDDVVLICEGLPDALTAAQAGYPSVGVLGAAYPDAQVAANLAARPARQLVVAFDADERGREGGERLLELLGAAGAGERSVRLHVPGRRGDVNDWARAVGREDFATELEVALAAAGVRAPPGRLSQTADQHLERSAAASGLEF